MKKEMRCWVVNDDMEILVMAGEYCYHLSDVHKGPQTHVLVKYYKTSVDADVGENETYQVFPIGKVFFKEIEF
jgi:hypothetical protein